STVVVSQYADPNDEDAWIYDAAAETISNSGFHVIRMNMPGYINYYNWIIPAIYVNWLQIDGAIIGNAYNIPEWDNEAQEVLEFLFPEQDVILLFTPEVNLSGGGIHCITNDQPSLTLDSSLELEHSAGWNLVCLPLEVEDTSYNILFPESTEGTLYSYDGAYISDITLIQGEGYWLRFNEAGSTTIIGTPINELTISLSSE
ncbi:MAG: agmatine deiminase family protein, partial [Candidatus Marinimicrobia bacterium]|nr:agmatine deiminase family protein [Candidatus Neomarinimicrobiota bacterium]